MTIMDVLSNFILNSNETKNWGKGIEPPEFTTKEEVQEMIDDAIRRHNRNASIISFCVGWVVLALFAEGLLRLIGVIEPLFPWLQNYIELIGTITIGVLGVILICQGHFIMFGKHGYKHTEREQHKLATMRKRVEELMGKTKNDL